jgi:hypothetical protein
MTVKELIEELKLRIEENPSVANMPVVFNTWAFDDFYWARIERDSISEDNGELRIID